MGIESKETESIKKKYALFNLCWVIALLVILGIVATLLTMGLIEEAEIGARQFAMLICSGILFIVGIIAWPIAYVKYRKPYKARLKVCRKIDIEQFENELKNKKSN